MRSTAGNWKKTERNKKREQKRGRHRLSNVAIYLSRENQKQFQAGFTYFPLLRACPKSPQYKLQIVLCLHHVLAACACSMCANGISMLHRFQNFQFYTTGKPSLPVCLHTFGRFLWSAQLLLLVPVVLIFALGRVLIRACGVNDLNQQGQNSV